MFFFPVCVFRPSSATMLYQQNNVSSSQILDAVFVPGARSNTLTDVGWPGDSQIYFYNAEQQLITLETPDHQQDSPKKVCSTFNFVNKKLSKVFMIPVIK